jgi:replicative superfamily II helicase
MVDFTQRTAKKKTAKPIDPIELYEGLDRASDKGPLRPVQLDVLTEWHNRRRTEQDLILKLHTGQGKTLIGLVLLLSKLNEGKGPAALYLCPNQYLVDQTVAEAEAFGVPYVTADDDIPSQFTDSQAVLIAVVHKLFNGRTQFGVGLKG